MKIKNEVLGFINDYVLDSEVGTGRMYIDTDDDLVVEFKSETVRQFINDGEFNTHEILQFIKAVQNKEYFQLDYIFQGWDYTEVYFVEIED